MYDRTLRLVKGALMMDDLLLGTVLTGLGSDSRVAATPEGDPHQFR